MHRWQNKSAKLKAEGKVYHVRDHRKWVAEKNSSICHLGIDPKYLRLDQIRFDVFHLSCAITRRLMSCLRAFINKQHCDVMDRFYSDALTFWGDYNIDVWKLNRNFTSFVGAKIKVFIDNIPKVIAFVEKNCAMTDYLRNLLTGLNSWTKLSKFLNISKLQQGEKDDYLENLTVFEDELKVFYSAGGKSFLTKGIAEGDDETFHMHCLRC